MTDDSTGLEQKTHFLAKLQIGKKYGGIITDWITYGNVICGFRSTDITEEFPKGRPIQTSSVVKHHIVNNTKVVETTNSYYVLRD